jgi:primosomal protein N' (replication factor Y) (superfamily II helicase)
MTDRAEPGDPPRVVRVLPEVPAIDKEFDYLVPAGVPIELGDVVRVELHGRRVGAWVVALDVVPEPGVVLKPLAKVSGRGPAPELIDLARWAAWRWAGRRASFLRTAAPPGVARFSRPAPSPGVAAAAAAVATPRGLAAAAGGDDAVARALGMQRCVLRLGPGADRYPLVIAAARATAGQTLVLCPSVDEARALGRRLRRDGLRTAVVAVDGRSAAATGEWIAAATTAQVVVGARAAAWAPAPRLARVVLLDEHDEAHQQEQAPTWHAREVVAERARRAGVPCLLVSPCPTLEAMAWGSLVEVGRGAERGAWPKVEVVDQRELDPSLGPLFSPRLVELVRGTDRVLCILNRTGRARLLACAACRTIARCEVCDAAVGVGVVAPLVGDAGGVEGFACGRCGTERPQVCLACGSARFKNLRLGVSRAREELETLVGEPVAEVTAAAEGPPPVDARVLIGTEALLHRVPRAGSVAFLDFDQELLALRYRAAEQALGLLARAARIVTRGGSARGRVLVQSRTPDHPVLTAARSADPERLVDSELAMRRALGLPPATAMALISHEAAPAFLASLGSSEGVRVQGPLDGRWRVLAPDHRTLCDALASVGRPPGRLRIEVDPLRG